MEDIFGDELFTLTDEEGVETQFQLLGSCETDEGTYYAVAPVKEGNNSEEIEYTILKGETDEDGGESFVTVDDDEEFDRVADIFEDELFSEVDYDEEDEEVGADN